MNGDEAVRRHFGGQAKACDVLGSPFTAALCRALAVALDRSTETGRRVLDWPADPRPDALALRLCGGLHALVLSGKDAGLAALYPPNAADETDLSRILPDVLARNDARLLLAIDSAPQTNEIGRSAMLLPGFLAIARETGLPLDLFEIGSSAGLNLLFDRFHYRYGEREWGDGDALVRLAPEVRGNVPPLPGVLRIGSRHGCDIAPIDVTLPDDRLRLRSYVWADQTARLERLDGAIATAASVPMTLVKADASDFVRDRLAGRREGAVFVLCHSIMWQYMPGATKLSIEEAMLEAGGEVDAASPLAWLRMEPLDLRDPHATLSLTLWPGGEMRHLARCDYHGRSIEWVG